MSKLNEIGISVEQNKAGFHILHVKNAYCEMSVSLYGGHIMSYIPVGQRDLLWMSSNAFFAEGQAIRGGIPVCWPWFGPVSQPAHGTARIHSWQLADAFLDADGETILILRYNEFSMDLSLEMRVHAGRSLLVELITNNHGSEEKHITEALHTYLQIGQIERIQILGLDGMAYFDKVRSIDAVQNGPVQICEETDRIYSGTIGKIIVKDAEWNRQICVERYGSNSAVVWNPWIDKSQRMNDFPDDGYHSMVCVEASNAGPDIVVVPPGGSHRLTTRISTI